MLTNEKKEGITVNLLPVELESLLKVIFSFLLSLIGLIYNCNPYLEMYSSVSVSRRNPPLPK